MKKLMAFVLAAVCGLGSLGCSRQAQEPFLSQQPTQETLSQEQPTEETLPQEQPTEETLPQEQPPQETLPCAKLPEDRSQPVELPAGLEQYVSDLTKSILWRDDTSHCEDEHLFLIDGKQFFYHDVCGTFRDPQSNQHAQVSPYVRNRLNEFLGHDPDDPPLSDEKYNVEVIDKYNLIVTNGASSYSPGEVVDVAITACITDCVVRVYVNGVHMEQFREINSSSTIVRFIMPCEDIVIEAKLISIFS